MKTIIKILICLSLIYTPMFANAAVGGWDLKNPVAQGASTVYDATKNVVINGKKFIKESSVKITPTATSVAKVLARGGAAYALSVAVEQLLGSVDWVLDPANNQVVYYVDPPAEDPALFPRGYARPGWDSSKPLECFSLSGCQSYTSANAANWGYGWQLDGSCTINSTGSNITCPLKRLTASGTSTVQFGRYANPAYDPEAEQPERERKTLPLETVAAQVISNAESDTDKRAAAQAATTAAAADIVAEAEKDDAKARPIASQAEANATTKPADAAEAEKANEAQGEAKPNEANPEATDLSITFPVFCNWAPTVCEAAQVVISFPQTLTEWWESANQRADEWETSISQAYHDFMRDDELPNDDTKVDITEHPVPELKEDAISWVASCPADESVPISLQGVSSTLVLSWSPWCQLLDVIKPAIIASAYIGAAFIVLGIRT